MAKARLTISIDLELAWGVWDILTPRDLDFAETAERPICAALLNLFDRYEVPATWATVAALLDQASAKGRPGPAACWYAPDIVEGIVRARVPHEFGSHTGRHIYFGVASQQEAREDLEFARALHQASGLPFRSLVFPRASVGHLDVLAAAGLVTFRGRDAGWFTAAARAGKLAGRVANFADKFLPIPPSPVAARRCGTLTEVPGSMLLLGRNGLRRYVLPAASRAKLRAGLDRAIRTGGIFHFWFHPSNFYYRRDEQLATLAWFLDQAAAEAGRGRIEIKTMDAYAGEHRSSAEITA